MFCFPQLVALLTVARALQMTTPHARPRATRRRPLYMTSTMSTMPAGLDKICTALAGLPDDKYRYKQLLFWAQEAPDLAPEFKVDENKVPGCLSTVHVTADLDEDGLVVLRGDSDAQLTKGLVVLLVKGLTGASPAEVQNVDPAFIRDAGIAASLTPGRNNGFVNMLNVIKRKTAALAGIGDYEAPAAESGAGPKAAALAEKLQLLQPASVAVADESGGSESSLTVTVVADCFAGLSEEKRAALVMTVAADVLDGAELAVVARTSAE
mmetsp:Transcript_22280/g.66871  ORF Transcript_22280/g.66871 Transcript_22280/m.66871 type:complete len:267 (+) Transcript_22280:118-918(+)